MAASLLDKSQVVTSIILVRCLYCEAESIVRLDQSGLHALQSRLGSAQSNLAQAMAALAKHASLTAFFIRGRTYTIAGLLILPLVWSFAGSWQSSYWSLLIALDVWVLGMCVFWLFREAFLAPVTNVHISCLTPSEMLIWTIMRVWPSKKRSSRKTMSYSRFASFLIKDSKRAMFAGLDM